MNREIIYSKGFIGDGYPVFIIAEIGINHNGSLDIAKKLIEGAKAAGLHGRIGPPRVAPWFGQTPAPG